ncbi:MAG TPA: zinc-ribbon domain-containing protein, partial [Polyangiaceae bacterium]
MEITCKRCYTEYDFDDALVSERGTTVRCTQCGEQFKVFRPPSQKPERWVINRADGRELVFTNLRDLQQAIVNVQVGRRDLLIHDDQPARALGSIQELEPFFAERMGATPVPPPPAMGHDTKRFGSSDGPRSEGISSRSGRTIRPIDSPVPPQALPKEPPPTRYAVVEDDPYVARRAEAERRAPRRSSPPPSSDDPISDDAHVAEQEWFAEPRFASASPQRSRAARWLVVLTLLGVIGIAIAALGRKYAQFSLRGPAAAESGESRVDI